jgi:hypothetical protein
MKRRLELVCWAIMLVALLAAVAAVVLRDQADFADTQPSQEQTTAQPERGGYAPEELAYRQLRPMRTAAHGAQAFWESWRRDPANRDVDPPASNLRLAALGALPRNQPLVFDFHAYRHGGIVMCRTTGAPIDSWTCLARNLAEGKEHVFRVTFRSVGGSAAARALALRRAERRLPSDTPAE